MTVPWGCAFYPNISPPVSWGGEVASIRNYQFGLSTYLRHYHPSSGFLKLSNHIFYKHNRKTEVAHCFCHLSGGDMLTTTTTGAQMAKQFTAVFKLEAAKLVVDHGYTFVKAAEAVNVSNSALTRLVNKLRLERQGKTSAGPPLTQASHLYRLALCTCALPTLSDSTDDACFA